MNNAQKLSFREKLGYGLGDSAGNFICQTQMIFMLSYYTDVVGLAATTVGWLFLISRLLDATNDFAVGALADRTETRWGKFRPWILWTMLPLAVSFVLAFSIPNISINGKLVWACVTYNLLMLTYTANNIPYSALTGVMTGDPIERSSLVTWRFVAALAACFFVQTFTLDLVDYFGQQDKAYGYFSTMLLWAIVAVVFFTITFLTTTERIQPDPRQKTSFKQDLRDLKSNRPWVCLALLGVFVFIVLAMRGGILLYYFRYYLQREDLFGWFNAGGMVASIIGVVLSKPLSASLGKRNTFILGLSLSTAMTCFFYIIPAKNLTATFTVQLAWSLSYGTTVPLLWAMIADAADYSEWKTGHRATATTFAASVFFLKVGVSIGSALNGWLLDRYGYVPNQAQSSEAIEGILLQMSLFPAMSFAAGVIVLIYYNIDKSLEHQIHEDLEMRRLQNQ